ncbi:MAG: pyridoxamine 5'-phosphate oxidase family protein, partial [Candidatus Limnocylindria bacterium]
MRVRIRVRAPARARRLAAISTTGNIVGRSGRHDGAVNPGRVLSPAARAFLAGARRAILATVAPDGRPRLVPVCFALAP